MSRPRRTASAPVSLFPFLAVLVSTMGALVLLLLAINRQVSLQAIAAAVSLVMKQVSAEEESLTLRRSELDQDVSGVQNKLSSVQAEHVAVEQKLIAADKQVRSDAARAAGLRRELALLTEQRAELRQAVLEIEQQVHSIQQAKTRILEEQKNVDRTFVPVVHPGASGTTRRPIYLECTAEGIVIQPEKILLPKHVLFAESGANSPLTRAVRSIAQYYLSRDAGQELARAMPSWEPYPLLLVRPDGIMSYGAARAALDHLDMPFGYELLDGDICLRFPESDPGVRAAALAALRFGSVSSGLARIEFGETGRTTSQERLGTSESGSEHVPRSQMEPGPESSDGAGQLQTGSTQSELEDDQKVKPAGPIARQASRSSPGAAPNKAGRPATSRDATQTASATHRPVDAGASGATAGFSLPANPQSSGKIPIPRAIVADCAANGLVLESRKKVIAISEAESIELAVEQLLGAVEREVSSWGPPGMTFRWEPRLVCRVHSDGLETFYRLRFALAGCSLAIEHKIGQADDSLIQRTEFLRALQTGGEE